MRGFLIVKILLFFLTFASTRLRQKEKRTFECWTDVDGILFGKTIGCYSDAFGAEKDLCHLDVVI